MFKPTYLIIHHTAVSYQINPDQFNNVNQYHKEQFNMKSSLGFWGGYNYIMSADGIIKQYRAEGEETAAVIGHNTDSLHLCLSGNFDEEQPTTSQRHNLRLWIRQKMKEYNIPPGKVVAHRKFSDTLCCGLNLTDKELSEMANYQEPTPPAPSEKELISLYQRLIVYLTELVKELQLRIRYKLGNIDSGCQ